MESASSPNAQPEHAGVLTPEEVLCWEGKTCHPKVSILEVPAISFGRVLLVVMWVTLQTQLVYVFFVNGFYQCDYGSLSG